MDLPRPEAGASDVLSQPTRARLFALLVELRRPAGTAELAERLALHPNGVRVHLDLLAQARLVRRTRTRHGPGRPSDEWTIAPDAHPGGAAPRAYGDLGRWLARAVRNRSVGRRGMQRTGREIGRELAPAQAPPAGQASTPVQAFDAALAALGFQPSILEPKADEVTFCVGNCPYRDAVVENQPAICALHEGITEGLLDVLAPQAKLVRFVPHDPDEAGCVIELRGVAAGPALP